MTQGPRGPFVYRMGLRATGKTKARISRVANVVHRAAVSASGGRVGDTVFGMPVVMLTTVGRKSGKARKSMMTTPIYDDDRIVVVASFNGDDHHPAWFLNLRDNPNVKVKMHGVNRPMKARIASPEERAELWPVCTSVHGGYADYQERTDREIPVVILEPLP